MYGEYDVVVIGGGLSGVACSLSLARKGKNVLLVERRPSLGWEVTWAGQTDLAGDRSPVVDTIIGEIKRVAGSKGTIVDGPVMEMTLDRLVRAAGVKLLLYTYPVRIVFEGNTALGVVLGNRTSEIVVRGRAIVDATEEALLWTQTETAVESVEDVIGLGCVYLNHVEEGMDLPLDLGDGVTVRASRWDGEVRIEYTTGADPISARDILPEVLRKARCVPQLSDALVTQCCNETFPSSPMVVCDVRGWIHPDIRNLFGCGVWAAKGSSSPVERLGIGERVARTILESELPSMRDEGAPRTGSILSKTKNRSDILVVGGGTGGSIAAIAAARNGMKTILVENLPALGGVGTTGAIHSYYHGLTGGIQDEVDKRIIEINSLFCGKWETRGFHPEAKKQVLHEMAREAGVDMHFNCSVIGVRLSGSDKPTSDRQVTLQENRDGDMNQIEGVMVVSPFGMEEYEATVIIDGTGDGDVAAMAGAPFIIGRESDNICHTYSQPAGRLEEGSGKLGSLNFDAGYVDPTDTWDMTRARRYGIQLYWQETFTEENRILYIAPLLGVRQGRQIIGEYQLTLADLIRGSRFEDSVTFTYAHYDNHSDDYENESEQALLWVWGLGNWETKIGCEVPYRCILPKNLNGLLIASRALSLTYDAHTSFRMQRDIQRIGEVAGLAASQALTEKVHPREINLEKLQTKLRETGILSDKHRPRPAIERGFPALPNSSEIDSSKTKKLVWNAVEEKKGVPALRKALKSSDQEVSFRASIALSSLGFDEGISNLIALVQNRDEDVPEGRHMVSRWVSAIPFLGISGSPEVLPTLFDVLDDPEASLDAIISSVRSLGRIGDPSAIPRIKSMLDRSELPTDRTFRTVKNVNRAIENARWQLELTSCEVLLSLGVEGEYVSNRLKPYLSDERAYVRRYAERVLNSVQFS